jgi:hypothetical protein
MHPVPETMTPILHEFAEVFQPLEGLPPSRHIGHSIHLILGSALPNAPTYRLAPTKNRGNGKTTYQPHQL